MELMLSDRGFPSPTKETSVVNPANLKWHKDNAKIVLKKQKFIDF